MPIQKRTPAAPKLNLKPVEEIILARKKLHGGRKGAPKKDVDKTREGEALNRAAMVMLAASLEEFFAENFSRVRTKKFRKTLSEKGFEKLNKISKPPRTTDVEQVEDAFLRIGIEKAFDGLAWQKCRNETLRRKLREINQIRNRSAHGTALTVDGKEFALTTVKVQNFVDFSRVLGKALPKHLLDQV